LESPSNEPNPVISMDQQALLEFSISANLKKNSKNDLIKLINFINRKEEKKLPWDSWDILQKEAPSPVRFELEFHLIFRYVNCFRFYKLYPCETCDIYVHKNLRCASCGKKYETLEDCQFFIVFNISDYVKYFFSSKFCFKIEIITGRSKNQKSH
jgi:hypothetical protein